MCKILRSRLYIIVNRFKDRGENMEDNKLLRLLHKDPNAGMEQLMNQYTGLVYAVVKSKLDDSYYVSSDIEDCVADVFSKFYAELSDYDPKISSIKTYLCVIARNQASAPMLLRFISVQFLSPFLMISLTNLRLMDNQNRK